MEEERDMKFFNSQTRDDLKSNLLLDYFLQ